MRKFFELKYSKELITAIIVIAACALLFWGINYLKGKDVFSSDRRLVAVYDDAGGLVATNPVLIHGLHVGKVKDIYFDPRGNGRVIVILNISNPIRIPPNSVARIYNSDLLGSKAIEIILGNAPGFVQSGDTILSETEISLKEEVNRQVQPLKRKAEDLMLSLDSVMTVIQTIFNTQTREHLANSFENIELSFRHIVSAASEIDTLVTTQRNRMKRILENVEAITATLKENRAEFSAILTNLHAFTDTLARIRVSETFDNTNKAMGDLTKITERINKGEGSVGMLVNNDSLYRKLEESVKNLNMLLEDMKKNPKRYVKFSLF